MIYELQSNPSLHFRNISTIADSGQQRQELHILRQHVRNQHTGIHDIRIVGGFFSAAGRDVCDLLADDTYIAKAVENGQANHGTRGDKFALD